MKLTPSPPQIPLTTTPRGHYKYEINPFTTTNLTPSPPLLEVITSMKLTPSPPQI